MNNEEMNPKNALTIDLQLHEFIILVEQLLKDLISAEGYNCNSIFNSSNVPQIKLDAYMRRIHKYTDFSPHCLILAVIYLDRYNMAQSEFCLNEYNVHRVLLACLILAVKFNDDIYFDNLTFEKAGGVGVEQIFQFEIEIFSKIGYNVWVSEEQVQNLQEKLYQVYGEMSEEEDLTK